MAKESYSITVACNIDLDATNAEAQGDTIKESVSRTEVLRQNLIQQPADSSCWTSTTLG
jgi:hypothetical protein